MLFCSCSDFLNQKPSNTINLPSTEEDLWALMNNISKINETESGLGEIGADNYFLLDAGWNGISQEAERESYFWKKTPTIPAQWNNTYSTIAYTNTVLDYADKVNYSSTLSRTKLLGTARFHRARCYYNILQVYSSFYKPKYNDNEPGFVYRKNSDISLPSKRLTLQESYAYLISEFEAVSQLLPIKVSFPSEPCKSAAFSLLSNLYLELSDFEKAYIYADSAIYYSTGKIIDYQKISRSAATPFQRFNEEVVFHTILNGGTILSPSRAKVTNDLLDLYHVDDLRREAFFRLGIDGYYVFKGNYNGSATSAYLFSGITVPELYLQRSEAAFHIGKIDRSLSDLNVLRQKRGLKVLGDDKSGIGLLGEILNERRRELAFRGRRWTDLRRIIAHLNQQIQIKRTINGSVYVLKNDDILNYAFFIPELVIQNSDISQNK